MNTVFLQENMHEKYILEDLSIDRSERNMIAGHGLSSYGSEWLLHTR